ncbi:MAG TPA: RimK family alpha-L-glutamate ligase [Anaeromyxobacter sp.]|nr:RimK family alpha-L-glutamate ligase [Anaeromyxobacter sp.]
MATVRKSSARPRRAPARERPAAEPRPASSGGLGIAILSRNPRLYSTRRLTEAAAALGHRPRVLDTLRCQMVLGRDRPRIFYLGEELAPADLHVAIPRIGASITGYGLSVVNQLDLMGVTVLNDAIPIARSRDKLRALQLLSRFGIDIPRTVMCRYRDEVADAVQMVGGLPCIIKLIQGTQGVGVMIANTEAEVAGLLDTLWTLGQEILLQELVAESRGKDVRALVVGDRVVAAMRRTARAGEFRSNIHRGGVAEAVELGREFAEAAVKAARVIGLEVAGVDMLEARTGPKIMEVNSSPGFEGIEQATGLDVATPYVQHAIDYAHARHSGYAEGRLA